MESDRSTKFKIRRPMKSINFCSIALEEIAAAIPTPTQKIETLQKVIARNST